MTDVNPWPGMQLPPTHPSDVPTSTHSRLPSAFKAVVNESKTEGRREGPEWIQRQTDPLTIR